MTVLYIMKTRKMRKGGMQDFNQMVIPIYSPIMSRGGRKRTIKINRKRRKMNRNRRTVRR